MSGPLRQLIGPVKARLVKYLDELNDPRPLVDNTASAADNIAHLRDLRTNLVFESDRISKACALLDSKNSEWSRLMADMDTEDHAAEEATYEGTALGDSGFIPVLEAAQEKLSLIRAWQFEVDDTLNRLQQQPISSIGNQSASPMPHPVPTSASGGLPPQQVLRLPKLQMPFFDGDPMKWNEFFDIFESSVHNQPISNVQKFSYLKSFLKSAALQAIEGMAVNNDNYPEAIKLLQNRFGNNQALKDSLYSNLRQLPPVNRHRVGDLRNFVDSVEKICRQLSIMGETLDHHSLVGIIMEKLPSSVVFKLEEQYKSDEEDNWTLASLRECLEKLVGLQERVDRITKLPHQLGPAPQQQYQYQPNFAHRGGQRFPRGGNRFPTSGPRFPNRFNSAESTAEAFAVMNLRQSHNGNRPRAQFNNRQNQLQPRANQWNSSSVGVNQQRPMSPCVFCGGGHLNEACPVFTTVEVRKKKLIEEKRCFLCLKNGCRARQCRQLNRWCFHCKRVGEHNRAICPTQTTGNRSGPSSTFQATNSSKRDQQTTSTGQQHNTIASSGMVQTPTKEPTAAESQPKEINVGKVESVNNRSAYLLTAQAFVAGDEETSMPVQTRVFLDCGSQKTFISKKLMTKLNLQPLEKESLTIHTFGGQKPCLVDSNVVSLKLFLKDGSSMVVQANALNKLTGTMKKGMLSSEDREFLKKFPRNCLAEPLIMEEQSFEPDIMVGEDYFWDLVDTAEKHKLPSGMYLLPSKLGLLLGGKYTGEGVHSYTTVAMISVNAQLTEAAASEKMPNLEEFWSLESIGITDSPVLKDDDIALKNFNKTIYFGDGRYHVKWPWKSEVPDLSPNYGLALGRFKSQTTRFQGDHELLKKCDMVIQDQESKGIIEKVSDDNSSKNLQHYLPHHPVISPDRATTKVRIVYDASAKKNANSNSLNDCLYRGPVILPDLCGQLIRFREKPIGIIADIEKAFLQVSLQPEDRDVTRFFWYKDPTRPTLRDNLQIYRFCRVTFGVVSSPFLLAATLTYHLQKQASEIALKIAKNIYVDNVLIGAGTAKEACQIYTDSKRIFNDASMNLREWATNSEEFQKFLPEKDAVKGKDVKVLGLTWDTSKDLLNLSESKILQSPESEQVLTKRQVLHCVASVFDPLGFFAPIVLLGKLFLQKLWKMKLGWDAEVPSHLHEEWRNIVRSLKNCHQITLPRHVGSDKSTVSNILVVFVDASAKAYAAVVYLRTECPSGEVKVTLVYAKTRLAPKDMSIPRMELMAMVIGVRAAIFVKKELTIPNGEIQLFSDSECVLNWLKSKKPLTVFVSNRLKEIKRNKEINFRYVQTKENSADCASRGVLYTELNEFGLWWNGPSWLKDKLKNWPKGNLDDLTPQVLQEMENEEKPKFFHETEAMVAMPTKTTPALIQVERFSSFNKLLTTVCFILQFLHVSVGDKLGRAAKEKFDKLFSKLPDGNYVSAKNFGSAKKLLVKQCQIESYSEILEDLKSGKKNCLIHQLGIYMDPEGLLRCHGRISKAEISADEKFPLLLPSKHHLTKLIVRDIHERNHHCGTLQTLAILRGEYWIPKGRMVVQNLLKKCVVCQKWNNGPYKLPEMPPLPLERVTKAKPFQYSGLDYFGPLWIKCLTEKTKVWICLFTCLVTRAVHLEVAMDMTAVTFLNCLRRFVARRGQPSTIVSDNAPQFKLTKTMIDSIWTTIKSSTNFLRYCASEGIKWRFITEYAPWQGGVYERMVGITKSTLKKAIGKKMLKLDELQTFLCEAEGIVNSRPLTFISGEIDSSQVLRPIDFLVPHGLVGTPAWDEDPDDPEYLPQMDSKQKLLKYWQKTQICLDNFWNLWNKDYLQSLRERFTTEHPHQRSSYAFVPKEGDMVLIKEENMPRGTWKIGRICKPIHSHDGQVRSAEVVLANNRKRLTRPINHLYPLELQTEEERSVVSTNFMELGRKPISQSQCSKQRSPRGMGWAALAVMFLLLPAVVANECPNNNDGWITIWSPNCTSTGMVIQKNDKTGEICWKRMKCASGHLNGNGGCEDKCYCPDWAFECSHINSKENVPKSSGDIGQILAVGKFEKMCSFIPKPNCSEKFQMEMVNQIELFDGTKVYVKELNIRWDETTSAQYECVGNTDGQRTGTPSFCANHHCTLAGTKFCYYTTNELAFYSNSAGRLPVKAYGMVNVKIYKRRPSKKQSTSCFGCNIDCITGGVQINLKGGMNFMEVCSEPFCVKRSFPNKEEWIMFPASINLIDHDVTVKLWSNGRLMKTFGTTCPSQPFCEMIDCYICFVRFRNLHCSSTGALLLISVSVYFLSITILVGIKLFVALVKILKWISSCLKVAICCCWKLCKLARNRTYRSALVPVYTLIRTEDDHEVEEMNESAESSFEPSSASRISRLVAPIVGKRHRQRQKLPYFLAIVALILSVVLPTESCSEVSTLQAKQSVCVTTKDSEEELECRINEVTRLALTPHGQSTCLLIRSEEDEPLGTIQLKIDHIGLRCQKKSEYFTRSYRMTQQAVKRCPNMGSCHDAKCHVIYPYTILEEFDDVVNNSPGFTRCLESCGGPLCYCFLPEAACLFYKTYAVPEDNTIYEVFSCPRWNFNLRLHVTLSTNNSTTSKILTLSPGAPRQWNDVELALISVSTPPSPILGSYFITDNSTVVLTKASASGQAQSGTVGSLQCATRKDAKNFACRLAHDSCVCQMQGNIQDSVSCICVHGRLQPLFEDSERILPMNMQGFTIKQDNQEGIIAEMTYTSALEVQVGLKDMKVRTKVDKSLCVIKPTKVDGCYDCLVGAKFSYTCKTDFGQALAHIDCEGTAFSTLCHEDEQEQNVSLTLTQQNVKLICKVQCPGGTTQFHLNGHLIYVPHETLFEISNVGYTNNSTLESEYGIYGLFSMIGKLWNFDISDFINNVGNLITACVDWIRNNLLQAILAIVIVVVFVATALVLTLLFIKTMPLMAFKLFKSKLV